MQKYENEDDIAWQIRCCLTKRRKQTDMDWVEIRDMLGLDITPDQLRKQAVGIDLYDAYIHNNSMVDNRILSISDLHIPFNLSIDTFKSYIGKVDTLVLNGDIEDCQSTSRFSKKYRIDVDKEMVLTRDFIIELINMIQPKKVIIVKGNHEYRMGRYLSDRLNEDLMSIMPDSPMDLIINEGFKVRDRINKTETWYSPISEVFKEKNIEVSYTGEWWRKVGNTIFAHPLSYSSGMLKTTEKAIEHFLRKDRSFNAIVLGHTHKLGSYIQGNIKMYEQGCCCDLNKLDYNDGYLTLPAQNGFIYICQDINGDIIPEMVNLVEL
jgi:predicted phosphodiesterase